jgi:hypothetical protein
MSRRSGSTPRTATLRSPRRTSWVLMLADEVAAKAARSAGGMSSLEVLITEVCIGSMS